MADILERPKIISLTERAALRVKHVMAHAKKGALAIRIGVKNGGCAGMEYVMDYAYEQDPLDEVVEDQGIKIFIDAKAILFLLGTQMDYEEGKLSSGFIFNNPNQTDACGCGESVTIIPAQY